MTLTVTGPNGIQNTDSLYIYVQDAGPNVQLSGQRTPDPDAPVTYTASVESPDAELEEIAWAIEDEIVAVRSLDGTTDESELSLAFRDAETHRVQVVVRDTNGRIAYDQLYVQPQGESSNIVEQGPQSEEGECDSVICLDIDPPDRTPENTREEPNPEPFEVRYLTDGYETRQFVGLTDGDSIYLGVTTEEFGLDGGENAHWEAGIWEKSIGSALSKGSKTLFGQEKKTAKCEMDGSEPIPSGCSQKIAELENSGKTSNVYSPTKSGAYSEYGLTGGERIRGTNPTDLENGEKAKVTVVIQQEEDGIVDKTVGRADSSAERISGVGGEILGENNADRDPSGRQTSNNPDIGSKDAGEDSTSTRTNILSEGINRLRSSQQKGTDEISLPQSLENDSRDSTDNQAYSPSRSGARFAQ